MEVHLIGSDLYLHCVRRVVIQPKHSRMDALVSIGLWYLDVVFEASDVRGVVVVNSIEYLVAIFVIFGLHDHPKSDEIMYRSHIFDHLILHLSKGTERIFDPIRYVTFESIVGADFFESTFYLLQ